MNNKKALIKWVVTFGGVGTASIILFLINITQDSLYNFLFGYGFGVCLGVLIVRLSVNNYLPDSWFKKTKQRWGRLEK